MNNLVDPPIESIDKVAIIGDHDQLTYRDMHAWADQIAASILTKTDGVRPGAIVLLLDHGVASIASALAAWKAGGHYVALDVSWPFERMVATIADAGARVVVTDGRGAETARELTVRVNRLRDVVNVDRTHQHSVCDQVRPHPSDPALLVYTSGSTGRPKGVWHDHAFIDQNARTCAALLGIRADDRMSLVHGLGTMASATTLWATLLSGAAVVPINPRTETASALRRRIADQGVTGLHLVPTVFRHVVSGADGGSFQSVRHLRLGGEAVTRGDWELWRRHFPPESRLHVGLGSSETGLAIHRSYDRRTPEPPPILPMGIAVPGTEVLVCTESGEVAEKGAVGRLVFRSRHLFRGYHHSPAATAEVRSVDADGFVTFRSGDLAMRDDTGQLVHLGRADAQVTIDGNRVEPGEVEHMLRTFGAVADAAVVARERPGGGKSLVAFVTFGDHGVADPGAVRAHLREQLPPHLVPAAIVPLSVLPRLSTGKIDRRALVDWAIPRQPPAGPRNELEASVAEIWQRVLGVSDLSVTDDLFTDLGANSLAAAQIVSETGKLVGRTLSIDTLYSASTVAAICERVVDTEWRPPPDGTLVVNGGGPRRPLFAFCGMYGHALRLLLVGRALGDDQPFYGLQPPSMDWSSVSATTVEAMAAHYVGVIRRVQARGPYRIFGTSFGGVVAFLVACRLQSAGDDVEFLGMVDTAPPSCVIDGELDHRAVNSYDSPVSPDPVVAMGQRVAVQHAAALETFALSSAFRGRLTYFQVAEPVIPFECDRRRLWSNFVTGDVRTVSVPGWHGNFHREPQFSAIVSELRRSLAPEEEVG